MHLFSSIGASGRREIEESLGNFPERTQLPDIPHVTADDVVQSSVVCGQPPHPVNGGQKRESAVLDAQLASQRWHWVPVSDDGASGL